MFELLKQFCVTIQQQELPEVDGRWISSVGSYASAHSFRDLYITHLLTITFSALWGVLARKSFKREVCLTELAVKAELEYITGTERVWVWVWLTELGLWRQLQMEYCDRKSLRMSLIGRALAWEQSYEYLTVAERVESGFGWQLGCENRVGTLFGLKEFEREFSWQSLAVKAEFEYITGTERMRVSLVDRAWLWMQRCEYCNWKG